MALTPERMDSRRALLSQVWDDNPIFRQVLGICSALAVTNLMFNTLLMCAGLVFSATLSALTVSLPTYSPGAEIRIGAGSYLNGTRIRRGSTVSAGAIVMGRFPPKVVIAGNPAKVIMGVGKAPISEGPV